jgi:Uri superfamily endonuclease
MVNQSIQITRQQGTYALIFKCETPFHAAAGKLGTIFITTGYWIYVGSAFGPGGLRSRLTHHLKPSTRPHWHLDYIKHALHPIEAWVTVGLATREHDWAGILSTLKGATRPIAGFGASDCPCRSHLIHLPRRPNFSEFKIEIKAIKLAKGVFFRYIVDHWRA